jgi:hypothetical protein
MDKVQNTKQDHLSDKVRILPREYLSKIIVTGKVLDAYTCKGYRELY